MYIINTEILDGLEVVKCGEELGKYIQSKGIPVLSITENGEMIFSITDALMSLINSLERVSNMPNMSIPEKIGGDVSEL